MDQVARLIRDVAQLRAAQRGFMGTGGLKYSSIEDGAVRSYDADGQLRLVIGQHEDGTQTVTVHNGPVPPAPSRPAVSVDGPVITVTWDGGLADDTAAIPADYRRVLVWLSDTAGLYPSTPAASIEPAAGASAVTSVTASGTYQVALAIESQAGQVSEWSESVPAVVTLVGLAEALDAVQESADGKNKNTWSPESPPAVYAGAAGDVWWKTTAAGIVGQWQWDGTQWVPQLLTHQAIASVDLGKATVGELDGIRIKARSIFAESLDTDAVTARVLAGDAIDGKVITGATVRTAASGARVQMDLLGFHAWDKSNTKTFDVDGTTGAVNIVGNFATGDSSSKRVEIRNDLWKDGAGLVFLPAGGDTSATAAMYQSRLGSPAPDLFEMSSAETANGTRNQIHLSNSSGVRIFSTGLSNFGLEGQAFGDIFIRSSSLAPRARGLSVGIGHRSGTSDLFDAYLALAATDSKDHWTGGAPGSVNIHGGGGVNIQTDQTPIALSTNHYFASFKCGTGMSNWAFRFDKGDDHYGEIGSPGGVPAGNFGIAATNRPLSLSGTSVDVTGDTARIYASGAKVEASAAGNLWLSGAGKAEILVRGVNRNIEMRTDGILFSNPSTTGTSANVVLSKDGWFHKSSSARKYKLLERPISIDYPDLEDRLLSLTVKTWFDKTGTERWAEIEDIKDRYGDDYDPDLVGFIPDPLERIPGVIAEDLTDAGLSMFVDYGRDGQEEGVLYDRLAVALIPAVRRQRDELESLRAEVEALKSAV